MMTKDLNDQGLALNKQGSFDALYQRVSDRIKRARSNVVKSINTEMIDTYWHIGREIVEEEQKGEERADYGEKLLKVLSIRLTIESGKGFNITNLRYMRLFYLTYPLMEKHHALRDELKNLSWTHYRLLTKVKNNEARKFYEIEANKNKWSSRELERQINSLLFERLAKSRDKDRLLKLAQKGQEIEKPEDIIKDPVVLEFINLPESHKIIESSLEEALISNLQHFLLELGKGFAFVGRQKRLTLDGDHFYADLVFYHTILNCYIIIDVKTGKLKHSDLGQMLLYTNYYDREVAKKTDNPTLGLILCTEKNDAVVRYTLEEKQKKIFTSKYQFYLPTVEELEKELKKEVQEIKYQLSNKKA